MAPRMRPSTPTSGTAPCRSIRSRSTWAATPPGTGERPDSRPTTGCWSSALRARSATSRSSASSSTSSARLLSADRTLAHGGAAGVPRERNHAAGLAGQDPVDQQAIALRRHGAHQRELLVEDHRREPGHAEPRGPLGAVAQHRLVGLPRVVGLEPLEVQRGLADETAQHVGAGDVEVVTEVRGEEPRVQSLERSLALQLGALRGRQRRDARRRQRRGDLRRHEARAGLLGADAPPALARLLGDAAVRLLAGDQRKGPPVDPHTVAVGLLDRAEPHGGVVAPGAQVVGEDVESDRRGHSRVNTVGRTTSVRSAWSACSTMRRRNAFSSSGERSALPSGWMIPAADTMRLAPTITATGVMVETCTVGSPARSSSRVIAAPQRVLVPQVEVRMTASTPAARSFSAISRPMRALWASVVATPTVE